MGETRLIQLLDQLNGPDDDDCEVAAIALGKMGEVALPHLAALLANDDADTRFWACPRFVGNGPPSRPSSTCWTTLRR